MRRTNKIGTALAGLVVLSLLAGCSGGGEPTSPAASSTEIPSDADPQLVATYHDVVEKIMPGVPFSLLQGAADEGTVFWYHRNLPAPTQALVAEFKNLFPFIKVEEYFDNGPPLFQRFMSEQRGGIYDADVVQTTNTGLMNQIIDEGYAAEYPLSSASLYPENDLTPYAYSFGDSTRAVYLYNTDLVDDAHAKALESWDGLWSGAFDDLPVAVVDPSNTSAALTYFYAMGKIYGEESWEALAALDPAIANGTASADAVSRGSAAVTFVSEGVAADALASGAPVRWTVPQPVIAEPGPQAVVANAPHPNAARLFQEFTFSETGQRIYSEVGLFISERQGLEVHPDIADQPWFVPFPDRKLYAFDTDDVDANSADIIAKFQELFL
jgi:ABC-type Fe3+ transport system substrate-binding protein